MKEGRTLKQLAFEIQRQSKAKTDYLADVSNVEVVPFDNGPQFVIHGEADMYFGMGENAHRQIGAYTGIPASYYVKLMTSPRLLAENVNHWLKDKAVQAQLNPERRMIRTLDGNVRAFLSDRYRRIDNEMVAEAVLPVIGKMAGADIKSCEITDDRLYLKVVNERLTSEVSVGDVVQAGFMITNSEVGLGSVNVSPLLYRLVCTNGMIAADRNMGKYKKTHVGRINESNVDMSIFRDETLEADDRAFMMKLQDAVRAAIDEVRFAQLIDQLREAKDARIEAKLIPKVVELTAREVGIQQNEQDSVLGHLIEGKDLSLYGLGNAVTRFAQDVKSYDRSTELESIGYKVITIAPTRWKNILSTARKETI